MSLLPILKVFIAGEGGVGKTTMVTRFVDGIFNANTILTIGVNHSLKMMTTKASEKVNLQIWDLGGEDRFRFVIPGYIKGSNAGIVVFDTSRYSTYKRLEEEWLPLIRKHLPDTPLYLVGSKIDLPDSDIKKHHYKKLVEDFNLIDLVYTSSKTGENVQDLFQDIANLYDNEAHQH